MATPINYDDSYSGPKHLHAQADTSASSASRSRPIVFWPPWPTASPDHQRSVALPTPASNRPSLEDSTEITGSPASVNQASYDHSVPEVASLVSPPASPLRIAKPATLDAIIARVRPVAEGIEETSTIKGVTPSLFEELDSWAAEHLPGWEGLRCETYPHFCHSHLTNLDEYRVSLHNDILIVGYPLSFGHEIIVDLLDKLRDEGHSFRRGVHGGKEVIIGESAGVRLSRGRKEPDCSLYVVSDDEEFKEPTIAYEVGYSEDEATLTSDAGKLICLTYGRIKLVVAIKITHKSRKSGELRELESVTWGHWELDDVDDPPERHQLNDPQPIEYDGRGIPTAYAAVVEGRKGKHRQLIARKVESHSVRKHHLVGTSRAFN